MADYIIVGGHGKVALLAARLLSGEGHAVTSIIRNPDQIAAVKATGASAVVLDVEGASQDELATAFDGKDAVIWSAGAGGGNPQRTYAVDRDAAIRSVDAARQAAVKRYLMVSYMGAGPDHGIAADDPFFPYADAKAASDAHLRSTDLAWTVLGPGRLTDAEPSGKIRVSEPLARDSDERSVSRGNVAQTIIAALEIDATIGQTIDYVDGDVDIRAAFEAV